MLVHPQQAPASLPFRNEYGVWVRHVPDGADCDLADDRSTSPTSPICPTQLTTTLLLSNYGLPKLHALILAKYIHKRAGNLELDSMQMTQIYEGWALQLLPTMDMMEFVRQIEHQHAHMSVSAELMVASTSGTEPVDDRAVPAAAGPPHDGTELVMLTHGADISSDITGAPSPPHSTYLMQPDFQAWCDDEANATLEQLFATLRVRHADRHAAPCPRKLCSRSVSEMCQEVDEGSWPWHSFLLPQHLSKHELQTDASSAQEWHAFMAAAGTTTTAEDMWHWEDGATLPSSEGKPENTLTRAELDVAFDRIKRDKATREFGVGIEAYIACPEAKEYLYELVQDMWRLEIYPHQLLIETQLRGERAMRTRGEQHGPASLAMACFGFGGGVGGVLPVFWGVLRFRAGGVLLHLCV
jgi:hypothetical protein